MGRSRPGQSGMGVDIDLNAIDQQRHGSDGQQQVPPPVYQKFTSISPGPVTLVVMFKFRFVGEAVTLGPQEPITGIDS